LNNETFGAAADVDKIDRNFDFTAGNSFFEKQIQGYLNIKRTRFRQQAIKWL